MGESLEKMSSAGLSPSDILSAILDEELERDLSTLAFFELFLLLSVFKFTLGGEAGIVRDEFSDKGLLCGSQSALKFISVFSARLFFQGRFFHRFRLYGWSSGLEIDINFLAIVRDLLDDSDLEFEDNDDYDADPSFTLPNQHGNNILYESSDSEVELDAVEAEQLETGRQVNVDHSVNEGNENGSIFEKVKWRIQSFTSKIFSENLTCSDEVKKNNKLWKVQPLIDFVRNRCLSIERSSTYYSIDEQMIPFLGRCQIRQFVKGKPRPVGLKNCVITTSDGLIIDFEIYKGLITPFPEKSLGLGPAVILRLINTIPEGSSVFFDRYFTTIPWMKKLVQLKIHGTGTIQMNRLQKFQFKADSKMKRGDFEEVVSDDKNIYKLKWKDNKSVVTTSTCYGGLPTTTVSRWDKTEKKYIDVQIPNMISKYNEKMGGVDHFDQMIEYYRTWLKTRKWPLKVILHSRFAFCSEQSFCLPVHYQ
ncbi:hypothetical protein QTP88_017339 [Uroleucon formosanum]